MRLAKLSRRLGGPISQPEFRNNSVDGVKGFLAAWGKMTGAVIPAWPRAVLPKVGITARTKTAQNLPNARRLSIATQRSYRQGRLGTRSKRLVIGTESFATSQACRV